MDMGMLADAQGISEGSRISPRRAIARLGLDVGELCKRRASGGCLGTERR